MTLYLFNIAFISLTYFIIEALRAKKKWFLGISLLYLFLISSFRNGSMGTDYRVYIRGFEIVRERGTWYWESGYIALNKWLASRTEDYMWLAIIVNLMLFIPLFFFIRFCVEEKLWLMIVSIFALNPYMWLESTFNILRQACATGILLTGMIFLLWKRHILNVMVYIGSVFLAIQFHKASYFMFVIPLVVYFPWKKLFWKISLGIALAMNLIASSDILVKIVTAMGFSYGYATYEASKFNHPVYVGVIVSLIAYLIYRYDDFISGGDRDKLKINLYMFSLCFMVYAVTNDMIYRVYIMMAYLALPGVAVIMKERTSYVTEYYLKDENKVLKGIYYLYYLVFYIGYLTLLSMNHNTNYIPFKFKPGTAEMIKGWFAAFWSFIWQ